MRHRPSSIGKSLAAFATVGSLLVGVVPSFGQDIRPTPVASKPGAITSDTKCREFVTSKELLGDAKCEAAKGQLLGAQGRALDTQLSKENDNLACMAKVRPFVAQGKVTRATLTKFGENGMCDLLKTLTAG